MRDRCEATRCEQPGAAGRGERAGRGAGLGRAPRAPSAPPGRARPASARSAAARSRRAEDRARGRGAGAAPATTSLEALGEPDRPGDERGDGEPDHHRLHHDVGRLEHAPGRQVARQRRDFRGRRRRGRVGARPGRLGLRHRVGEHRTGQGRDRLLDRGKLDGRPGFRPGAGHRRRHRPSPAAPAGHLRRPRRRSPPRATWPPPRRVPCSRAGLSRPSTPPPGDRSGAIVAADRSGRQRIGSRNGWRGAWARGLPATAEAVASDSRAN